MGIVDINYEENRYEAKNATLTYNNILNQYDAKRIGPIFMNIAYLPNYVSIKNKTNMFIPSLKSGGISPFGDPNPDLKNMFGFHIFDKQFGFNKICVVNPVTNYPYMGNDSERKGSYTDYNGILSGYVMNGISAEDVVTKLDEEIVHTYTKNYDGIENPKTLRIIYTSDKEGRNLHYGPYIIDENDIASVSYFFVPVRAKMDDSGNLDNPVYGYVRNDKCVIVNKITVIALSADEYNTVTGSNLTDEEFDELQEQDKSYETYKEVSPEDVRIEDGESSTFYVQANIVINNDGQNSIELGYILIKNDEQTETETFDKNGLVYYTKNTNGGYDRGGISCYQYIEVTSTNDSLTASDGYGEDAEIMPSSYTTTPSSFEVVNEFEVNDTKYKALKINKADIEQFDSFTLYRGQNKATINCVEKYWSAVNTNIEIDSSEVEIEVDGLYTTKYKTYPVVTKKIYFYDNGIGDGHEVKHIECSFKLGENTYSTMKHNPNTIWCKNTETKNSTDKGCSEKQFFAVVAGLKKNANITYTTKETSDDGLYVTLTYILNDDYYIGYTPKIIDGAEYYFDKTTEKIMRRTQLVSIKPVSVENGVYSVKLKCGEVINFMANSVTNGRTLENTISVGGIVYPYKLSGLVIASEETLLEYPQEVKSSIFHLLENNNWSNKCEQINTVVTTQEGQAYDIDPYNVYFNIGAPSDSSNSNDTAINYVFLVGMNGNSSETVPTYYTYSPKLCLEIPKIYDITESENVTIVITGEKEWTDSDSTANDYLRYYDFTINRLVKTNEQTEYEVEETIVVDSSRKLDKYSINGKEFYGYTIEFTVVNSTLDSDSGVNSTPDSDSVTPPWIIDDESGVNSTPDSNVEYCYSITDCTGMTISVLTVENDVITKVN